MHPADQESRRGRWDSLFLIVAMVALLLVRLPFILHRYFDPDEFEHVHAAWSVFRGQVPYRDFFEHHTPWYYFLLAPFFPLFEVDQSFESAHNFLLFARGLSLVLTALSVFLLYRVASLGGGRRAGLLAGLFLLMQPVLILKTLEIRPDVPALPFFLGALWCLLRGLREDDAPAPTSTPSVSSPSRWFSWRWFSSRWSSSRWSSSRWFSSRWFLWGGFLLGGAILCTQKMLFVLPGAFTALALWAAAGGRSRLLGRSVSVAAVLAGLLLPVALTWAAFALQGGGRQFIVNNFLLNAKWKLHSSRHFQIMWETTWPMLALAVVGVVTAVWRFFRETPGQLGRNFGPVLLLGTMGGLFAGLLVVPAAYRQYYMMPLPLACVFAAEGLCFLVSRAREGYRPWFTTFAVLVLMRWPVHHFVETASERNDRQMERLRYVLGHTRPTDLVLDGWLGTQLFRPQPLYYGFLHREILAMLSETQLDDYLGPLESGRIRPALITLDTDLRFLGPRFARYLRTNYVSNDGEFFWPRLTRPLSAPHAAND